VCIKWPALNRETKRRPREGPPEARVVLIGEGQGGTRTSGRPFVGAAGKQLEALLSDAGLSPRRRLHNQRGEVRPPETGAPPEPRRMVPCLSGEAARAGGARGSSSSRGHRAQSFLPDEAFERHGRVFKPGVSPSFPTYHPAAMIYNRALEGVIREDFRALAESCQGLESGVDPRVAQHQVAYFLSRNSRNAAPISG